jgi:cell division protein FtsI/penicillin-binding protein 2
VTAPSGEWSSRSATSGGGDSPFPPEPARWEGGDYVGNAAPFGGQDARSAYASPDVTIPLDGGPVGAPAASAAASDSAPADAPSAGTGGRDGRHASRHRRVQADKPGFLKRRGRMAGALLLFVAVVSVGFSTGFGTQASAEPVVTSFLLDWEQGHYTSAAQLTNGDVAAVSAQLSAAFHDLDATEMFLSMRSVTQHGSTARAVFTAVVDLGGGGHQWSYNGSFGLVSSGGRWLIDWKPGVIQPGLGPGDRLAVVTSFPRRGQVTDASGSPLTPESTAYHVGVYPGNLRSPRATAAAFSQVTGVNSQQVLGQLDAAPPRQFLSLLTLDPGTFATLWPSLSRVPGLTAQAGRERLFDYNEFDAVGTVGTENSSAIVNDGEAYEPGATFGGNGLEAAYQDTLAGTTNVRVVIVNAAGRVAKTLWTSAGTPARSVRTTISGKVQAAANKAIAALPASGEIVAVDSETGDILALAGQNDGDMSLPSGGLLNAQVQPGLTFTIVSAAALLSDGLHVSSPLPCEDAGNGGQTVAYMPGHSSSATFASDFASGCGTAFAAASTRLTPAGLASQEKAFGVGASWDLPVSAFSGSASPAAGESGLAAQAVGSSGVKMSPLGMALVAAAVDAGASHSPVLVASGPVKSSSLPMSADELTALRGLMRGAVQTGPASAADLSGTPVYGQAGAVQTGPNAWLSWFVGYRGSMAFAVLETGRTQSQAAASLTAAFLSAIG